MTTKNKTKKKILTLSLKDRMGFGSMMPKSGNFLKMALANEFMEKTFIKSDELKAVDYKEVTNDKGESRAFWNSKKEKHMRLELKETEYEFLKEIVDKLDEDENVTLENIELVRKIKALKS